MLTLSSSKYVLTLGLMGFKTKGVSANTFGQLIVTTIFRTGFGNTEIEESLKGPFPPASNKQHRRTSAPTVPWEARCGSKLRRNLWWQTAFKLKLFDSHPHFQLILGFYSVSFHQVLLWVRLFQLAFWRTSHPPLKEKQEVQNGVTCAKLITKQQLNS